MNTACKFSKTARCNRESQNETQAEGKDASLKSKPPGLFQAKLSVGEPDDPYEQEADKVSHQVMDNYEQVASVQRKLLTLGLQTSIQPMPVGKISRKLQRRLFRNSVKNTKTDRIQFDGDGAVVSSQIESGIQAQHGSGHNMDPITQTAMESSFGADFSSVKIHTDSTAVQMSRDLNAHAFTIGTDIFFNEGRYQPQTKWGAGLLAHELTHVVQQGGAVQNKTISRLPYLDLFSNSTISKLSSVGGSAAQQAMLYRKEIAQFQKEVPEEKMLMQQKQMLQAKEIDKVQTHSNAKIMRLYGGGGTTPPATKKAKLKSGPKYTPNGTLKPTLSGGMKVCPAFTRTAEFEQDPAKGIFASCGIVMQSMKWSVGEDPPHHAGWTPASNFSADTWYEDRNESGLRASPRSGPTSFCASGATNGIYLDSSGNRDCANGTKFEGHDQPSGLPTRKGFWYFKLEAIDTCNSNNVLGTDYVTVDWS
jgi:Domain of unknown function (DUF4157)